MHPVLFHLGGVTVYTYGVLVATGVLIGLWVARRQARRAGLDPERIWNLGIYMVLAALVTAKLWLVVLYWSYYVEHPRELFALSTLQSGVVFSAQSPCCCSTAGDSGCRCWRSVTCSHPRWHWDTASAAWAVLLRVAAGASRPRCRGL